MTTTGRADYREAASSLTPAAVAQFLAAHDWQLEARQDRVKEIWRLPSGSGHPAVRLMLPLATEYIDYLARFTDTLTELGHIHDWDAGQLIERVAATRADLVHVRLDQPMTDGTIPFQQADNTLQALYKLLKAAATSAAAPGHSHRGRRPAVVSDFLDESVRLGHTKRGSFVFTVVTRLGEPVPDDQTVVAPSSAPFARLVMATMAQGLETTRRLTREWDEAALATAAEQGLSAGLVEAVEDMTQPEELRSLDLSFDWAAGQSRPDVGLEPIVLDRDVKAGLSRVREKLIRREEPPRREILMGLVKSITREDAQTGNRDERVATVVLFAEVGGRMRNVHVTVVGRDHEWAVMAYQINAPLTVSGDLVFERRAWRLTGHVEVDPSFLEHYSASHPSSSDG
ncbi:hypothetical protein [Yinghuangia sp. YIM S09857]|uniref:hypothetical protein n=1 Tax=Yinghuangia sp. YIM S09857 TaxID=3436929 RepID=UPI003F533FBF